MLSGALVPSAYFAAHNDVSNESLTTNGCAKFEFNDLLLHTKNDSNRNSLHINHKYIYI